MPSAVEAGCMLLSLPQGVSVAVDERPQTLIPSLCELRKWYDKLVVNPPFQNGILVGLNDTQIPQVGICNYP